MMGNIDKDKLLAFIRKEVPSCLEITSFRVNDYDGTGEDGDPCFAGENITANCILECPDTSYPVNNLYGRKKSKIQVKTKVFMIWLESVQAVKIIG